MINQTQRNVLLAIARVLELAPDYRVGQILANCAGMSSSGRGVYDLDDEEVLEVLLPMIRMMEETVPTTLEEQLLFAKSA